MGKYTSAKSFDDNSSELAQAPTDEQKDAASKVDVLQVQNTMGSTAGAGSGEFHMYRASRRREMNRIEKMDVDARKKEEIDAFETRKRERAEGAEAQHQKRADKRRKKKDKKKGKTGAAGGGGAASMNGAGAGGGEEEEGEEEAEEEVLVVGPQGMPAGHEAYIKGTEEAARAQIKHVDNVRIIDDD